jgi:hypothetical protein
MHHHHWLICWGRVLLTFWLSWPWIVIVLISTSWVAEITGVNHCVWPSRLSVWLTLVWHSCHACEFHAVLLGGPSFPLGSCEDILGYLFYRPGTWCLVQSQTGETALAVCVMKNIHLAFVSSSWHRAPETLVISRVSRESCDSPGAPFDLTWIYANEVIFGRPLSSPGWVLAGWQRDQPPDRVKHQWPAIQSGLPKNIFDKNSEQAALQGNIVIATVLSAFLSFVSHSFKINLKGSYG